MDHFIGIDVAKATLDVASLPDGEGWSMTNDEARTPRVGAALGGPGDLAAPCDRVAASYRAASTIHALICPSTAPLPNRWAMAPAAISVASSSRPGPRTSISERSGVPWQ